MKDGDFSFEYFWKKEMSLQKGALYVVIFFLKVPHSWT